MRFFLVLLMLFCGGFNVIHAAAPTYDVVVEVAPGTPLQQDARRGFQRLLTKLSPTTAAFELPQDVMSLILSYQYTEHHGAHSVNLRFYKPAVDRFLKQQHLPQTFGQSPMILLVQWQQGMKSRWLTPESDQAMLALFSQHAITLPLQMPLMDLQDMALLAQASVGEDQPSRKALMSRYHSNRCLFVTLHHTPPPHQWQVQWWMNLGQSTRSITTRSPSLAQAIASGLSAIRAQLDPGSQPRQMYWLEQSPPPQDQADINRLVTAINHLPEVDAMAVDSVDAAGVIYRITTSLHDAALIDLLTANRIITHAEKGGGRHIKIQLP